MSIKVKRCRICLTIDGTNEMYPIFRKDGEIAKNIFDCLQIKIIDYKDVPNIICRNCLNELTRVKAFKLKAKEAQEFFRKSLNLSERENWSFQGESTEIHIEPHVVIKLEDDDSVDRIKLEPTEGITFSNVNTNAENQSYFEFSNVNVRGFDEVEEEEEEYTEVDDDGDESKNQRPLYDFGTSQEVIQCNLCFSVFPSLSSKTNHMRNVHGKLTESEMHKCKFCNRYFKHKNYLNRHITRVHPNENKKTHSKKSESKSSKTSSLQSKEDISLYCEICKQFFTTRGNLQKHVKVKHKSVDNCMCDLCGEVFAIKYCLIRHMKYEHFKRQIEKKVTESNDMIPCEICGKLLKNRGLLKPHMRSHQIMTPEDYWYCDLCPRKFKTRGGCTWHIKQRHILKASFKCHLCPVVYKGKWELKCHIKSKHTTIRDYCCEICGKGFLDKQKLQIHTR